MPKPMKIDFVSDVSCPWCIIGLRGLEEALARTGDLIDIFIVMTFTPLFIKKIQIIILTAKF